MEPKVALLFLVTGNLHQPSCWEKWLEDEHGNCSIFCHPKDPEAIRDGPLIGRVIDERHHTWWGHLSLVIAMLALLRAAVSSSDFTHFVFLSESCVPIRPLADLLETLKADARSRFPLMSVSEAYAKHPDKPGRFTHTKGIPHDCRYFHPQWILLEREAATLVLANDKISEFEGVVAADECYFGTVLSIAGWDLGNRVVKENVTWSRWSPGAWHPDTIEEITPDLLSDWRRSGCFFARKIAPHARWHYEDSK